MLLPLTKNKNCCGNNMRTGNFCQVFTWTHPSLSLGFTEMALILIAATGTVTSALPSLSRVYQPVVEILWGDVCCDQYWYFSVWLVSVQGKAAYEWACISPLLLLPTFPTPLSPFFVLAVQYFNLWTRQDSWVYMWIIKAGWLFGVKVILSLHLVIF